MVSVSSMGWQPYKRTSKWKKQLWLSLPTSAPEMVPWSDTSCGNLGVESRYLHSTGSYSQRLKLQSTFAFLLIPIPVAAKVSRVHSMVACWSLGLGKMQNLLPSIPATNSLTFHCQLNRPLWFSSMPASTKKLKPNRCSLNIHGLNEWATERKDERECGHHGRFCAMSRPFFPTSVQSSALEPTPVPL